MSGRCGPGTISRRWPVMIVGITILSGQLLLAVACQDGSSPGTSTAPAGPAASRGSSAGAPNRPSTATGAAPLSPAPTNPSDDDLVGTVDDEPEVDHEAACAPVDPGLEPLQLLRFTFTDGVKNKDPKQKLNIARPGQRVYAHLRLRNRSGRKRCVHVVFRVGGDRRTDVTLKVGKSWSWRTWAYNTVKSDDTKPLQVVVTDDQGNVIVKKALAVVPE